MIQNKTKHVKASTWIPKKEYDEIERIKGDISVSLWIKRAIKEKLALGRTTNLTPEAAVVEATTTTNQQRKEVEVS